MLNRQFRCITSNKKTSGWNDLCTHLYRGVDVTNTLQNPFMGFWGRLISFDNWVI
jgi:hypothetical protein